MFQVKHVLVIIVVHVLLIINVVVVLNVVLVLVKMEIAVATLTVQLSDKLVYQINVDSALVIHNVALVKNVAVVHV